MVNRSDPIFDRWWNSPHQRIFDQSFGDPVDPDDFFASPPGFFFETPRLPLRRRLFSRFPSTHRGSSKTMSDRGFSEIKSDRNKFQVMLDVQQFLPEELNVKSVDNYLVVEGKHDEREDAHGIISRQFTRKYMLPEDVRAEELACDLSNDGIMLISAPRIPPPLKQNERLIPIIQTGQTVITKDEKSEEKPTTSSAV